MPIDFSNYVYLTPYDVSPTSVYLDAIDYAKIVLPEFQPRQGTPEDAILQAVSYISALNMSAINRLPDRLMSGLVGMMGVEIDDGLKAVADITFTAIDYEGTIIPQGTVVRYDYEFLGEQRSVYFQTVEEGEIVGVDPEDPLPTVTVEAEAIDVGVVLPIPDNTELTIDTPTSSVISAVLDTLVNPGRNPETSDEFLTRAVTFLGSLSSSFARASQIEGYILSNFVSTVSRCKVFDLTNAGEGLQWDDPDAPGHVTIFTWGINQELLEPQKLDILVAVQNRAVAGLDIAIETVNLVPLLDFEISVAHSSDYDSSAVEENIRSVLISYFSPTNYRFTDAIKFSEFYSVISAVPGVIYAEELSVTPGTGGSLETDGIYFDLKGSLPTIENSEITINLTSLSQ